MESAPLLGQFVRTDEFSFRLGKIVTYRLHGFQFMVIAHQRGVEFAGRFPVVDAHGIREFKLILDRAVRHHKHLASFRSHEVQTYLDETVLEEMEKSGVKPGEESEFSTFNRPRLVQ